ncbi:CoA-transferase [Jiangella mangrovi]|uniref:Glutaconate CoA-transferase subunit A n=1 Tax=Jiangella mangrovi TaxID=1524084 RepID=A0A7W9GWM0_9ACTN|nr:glutaconate CoA-transferase subunit A [Jiangella mangrovi]
MSAVWADDVASLVADVPAGARVGVSGFHFTRAPVAALLALADAGVRDLHYVAWGGGLPLEILLGRGAVTHATLCFSSLDVLGPAPRFRRAVESGALALNEQTALGLISGLRAAGENLPFEVFQEPAGSSLADGFSAPAPDPYGSGGAPLRAVRPVPLDVLLLHAQRADDDGNVELAGARGLDLPAIFAARRVLVTVEERVPRGSLGAARSFVLPRTFVSRLAVAQFGAYPTSCLPYYPADYRALRTVVDADPAAPVPEEALRPSPAVRPALARRAAVPARSVGAGLRALATVAADAPYTIDELMVAVLARTIGPTGVCSFGSASPLPTAAYFLAKHLWAPDLLLMSHNGGLVDVPVRPLALAASEQLDHELAAAHTGGDETYHWYYQRGLVTHEVVGSAQVDGRGATNNLWVAKSDGTPVRLPGQGGMADVANLHANFMIYLPRQSTRNTPARVETVSARRAWHDPDQRRRFGLQPGRTLVVTDLAVFEDDPADGTLRLRSLHPGVSLDDLRARTGFDVVVPPGAGTTEPPTPDELHALRTVVDPLGVRRLDLVGAADRQRLVDRILDLEETVLDPPTIRSADAVH